MQNYLDTVEFKLQQMAYTNWPGVLIAATPSGRRGGTSQWKPRRCTYLHKNRVVNKVSAGTIKKKKRKEEPVVGVASSYEDVLLSETPRYFAKIDTYPRTSACTKEPEKAFPNCVYPLHRNGGSLLYQVRRRTLHVYRLIVRILRSRINSRRKTTKNFRTR